MPGSCLKIWPSDINAPYSNGRRANPSSAPPTGCHGFACCGSSHAGNCAATSTGEIYFKLHKHNKGYIFNLVAIMRNNDAFKATFGRVHKCSITYDMKELLQKHKQYLL